MTVIKFMEDYVPCWLSDKFREECCKQDTWNPHIPADPMMITRMLTWSRTKDKNEFWSVVSQIIAGNFKTPDAIQALINDVPAKMIKKEMTIADFVCKHMPCTIAESFMRQSKEHKMWNGDDKATKDLITEYLPWMQTKEKGAYWGKVHAIVNNNFHDLVGMKIAFEQFIKETTKQETPEIKPMTIGQFTDNYIPYWAYTKFVAECCKQNTWEPLNQAYPNMIDGMLKWDKTDNGDLWNEINEIIIDNFDTPKLIQAEINDIRDKFSPSKPQPKEESSENKETNKMKLDKYANQTVATVTLVEGVDISDLSPSSIIAQIKAHKRAVKDLEEAGISGAYLNRESAKHNLAISTLQTELNSRVSAEPTPAPAEA